MFACCEAIDPQNLQDVSVLFASLGCVLGVASVTADTRHQFTSERNVASTIWPCNFDDKQIASNDLFYIVSPLTLRMTSSILMNH